MSGKKIKHKPYNLQQATIDIGEIMAPLSRKIIKRWIKLATPNKSSK